MIEGSVYSVNISAGGFCLGLDRLFKPNTVLEFEINLPDKNGSFDCYGKISWQNPKANKSEDGKVYFDTGIMFEKLNLTNRLRLIAYVHGKLKTQKSHEEKIEP